jgi:hypothetical protein
VAVADRGAVTSAFVHGCRFPSPVRFELVAIWWPGVQRSCRWLLGQPRGLRMGIVPSRQSRGRPGFPGAWATTRCFTIGRPRRANRAGSRRRPVRRPAARRLRRPRPPARSCTRDRPRRPRRRPSWRSRLRRPWTSRPTTTVVTADPAGAHLCGVGARCGMTWARRIPVRARAVVAARQGAIRRRPAARP